MIVLDIEASGLDFEKCGIWQIGAIDFESNEEFLEECKIDDEDLILETSDSKNVLEIIGKSEEELRDKNKQTQKEMIEKFFEWVAKRKEDIFLCMNPQFDIGYIWVKARKYGLEVKFQFKAFDLHTISQLKYFEIHNDFLFEEGKSKMGLKRICDFCGVEDRRDKHNALEDCKLTGECFSRLVYGKNIFSEYSKFEIPGELKNDNL